MVVHGGDTGLSYIRFGADGGINKRGRIKLKVGLL